MSVAFVWGHRQGRTGSGGVGAKAGERFASGVVVHGRVERDRGEEEIRRNDGRECNPPCLPRVPA